MSALGDEERDVAVAEVVEPHRLSNGVCNGREPEAAAECVAPEGSTFGCGEDQPVGSGGMVFEMLLDDVGEPGRRPWTASVPTRTTYGITGPISMNGSKGLCASPNRN